MACMFYKVSLVAYTDTLTDLFEREIIIYCLWPLVVNGWNKINVLKFTSETANTAEIETQVWQEFYINNIRRERITYVWMYDKVSRYH